ncbi:flagellar hook-length control protein FliK [Halomonas alkalisoli]|uniref:flagellar hook-length control protein FliK n=1 Tax=Halomonas alkalisoli TaxID=2907158 RepID=UPI001F1FA2BD|nr:flagellar hook-length control protein FliK [Halomonas alkalisoli]MCE9682796.1 flagellar hook-length control protein FliK [Halomonas alkalisoli]
MDIQMILSALPGKPMGNAKPIVSTADGHFALALASAGRPQPNESVELPTQRPTLPPTMAARQTMLQALNDHDPDFVADVLDMPAVPLPESLSLSEIMERLALIDDNPQAEARPLTDIAAPQATAAEQAAKPTTRAETLLAAADALRQATGDATRTLGTPPAGSAETALNTTQPLPQQASRGVAEATPHAALLAQLEPGAAERPLRVAEFARSADMSPQSNAGELRGMAAEVLRPASIELTSSSLQATTQPTGTAPQAMPSQAMPAQTMPAQASLPSPVQSQVWPGQLGQQLVQFARHGGEQRIEMKLNPAELGPLSVTLKMTEHGAQAQFLSAHAQIRQVLEQAIPQLREALAEQGISLGETSVGDQRQQEGQAFANQEGQRDSVINGGEETLTSAAEIDMAENTTGISLDGRVNLYA